MCVRVCVVCVCVCVCVTHTPLEQEGHLDAGVVLFFLTYTLVTSIVCIIVVLFVMLEAFSGSMAQKSVASRLKVQKYKYWRIC